MNLLIQTIPLLNKGKEDVFLFFRGAGVTGQLVREPYTQWSGNRGSINKFDITRQVLTKLNDRGESCLRERREVLKRVLEFETYSMCWADDQLKARGLVAEIQKLVNIKDSFTRMAQERDSERKRHVDRIQAEREHAKEWHDQIAAVKKELFSLFGETNPQKRGKAMEGLLNRLFQVYDISINEAFSLTGDTGDGVVEQIDGVIEIDGHIYFVEMKWWNKPIGVGEVSQHLVRVMSRSQARAIVISASDFTAPAISQCKEALQSKVVILCTLQELVMLLERRDNLIEYIQNKVRAAITHKNPYLQYAGTA